MRTDRKIRWNNYFEKIKPYFNEVEAEKLPTQEELDKIKIECGIPTYLKDGDINNWLEGII